MLVQYTNLRPRLSGLRPQHALKESTAERRLLMLVFQYVPVVTLEICES